METKYYYINYSTVVKHYLIILFTWYSISPSDETSTFPCCHPDSPGVPKDHRFIALSLALSSLCTSSELSTPPSCKF